MYETTHLALAAYFMCLGYPVQKVEKDPNKDQMIFFFPKTSEIIADAGHYYKHNTLVEPQKFFNCIKELKTMIYAAK